MTESTWIPVPSSYAHIRNAEGDDGKRSGNVTNTRIHFHVRRIRLRTSYGPTYMRRAGYGPPMECQLMCMDAVIAHVDLI